MKKRIICSIVFIVLSTISFAQENSQQKDLDLFATIGYAPSFVFAKNSINSTITPVGLQAKFGIITKRTPQGNIGINISSGWVHTTTTPHTKKLTTNFVPFRVNFIYQYDFNDRLTLNTDWGMGITAHFLHLKDEKNDIPRLAEFGFLIGFGASIHVPIQKKFYGEAGIDYSISFPGEIIQHLQPVLAIGYKF